MLRCDKRNGTQSASKINSQTVPINRRFAFHLTNPNFLRKNFVFIFLLLVSFYSKALCNEEQPDNNPQRYQNPVFEEIDIKKNILYGSNKSQAGKAIDLYMDIYSPMNDSASMRPVIILSHGGYYLNGGKDDFAYDCIALAKAGYIAISINYRLIDVMESPGVYKRATADAVNDTKAAVRFFRKDFENENLYHVDTSNIFIGGYSAGAITSLHYAYANTPKDVFSIGGHRLIIYVSMHGGVQGDSGNPGYSSRVKGVLNISGSIHLANMIDKNEPILFSVHGTADKVVPFKVGQSGYSWVRTEGSGLVHDRANDVGLLNKLIAIQDAEHGAYFRCQSCRDEMQKFIFENIN